MAIGRYKIALTGDVIPTRRLPADTGPGRIKALFDDADLVIGNFEIPLTSGGSPHAKLFTMRADPAIAQDIGACGFDAVTLANNHAPDYGWQGLSDTIAALNRYGVRTTGAGATYEAAIAPVILTVGELTVGIVASSCLVPAGADATSVRPGIAATSVAVCYEIDPFYQVEEPGDPAAVSVRTRVVDGSQTRLTDRIRSCREHVDVLIAAVHWGFGSGDELADYQQPLGRALVDAGADIVWGHHPHAIHPVELYRDRPIVYSAGTFIGQQVLLDASPAVRAMWDAMLPDGFVSILTTDGTTHDLAVIPTSLDATGLPTQATGAHFEHVHSRIAHLSEPFDTATAADNGRIKVLSGSTAGHEAAAPAAEGG